MDPLDRYINKRYINKQQAPQDRLERISRWVIWGIVSMFPVIILMRFVMVAWAWFATKSTGDSVDLFESKVSNVINILRASDFISGALLLIYGLLGILVGAWLYSASKNHPKRGQIRPTGITAMVFGVVSFVLLVLFFPVF